MVWNELYTGVTPIANPADNPGPPTIMEDSFVPPAPGTPPVPNHSQADDQTNSRPEAVIQTASPGVTSAYMSGRVAVRLIFPESTGAASMENWYQPLTARRVEHTTTKIVEGLNWWAARESRADLTLVYSRELQNTAYEPISLTVQQEELRANLATAGITSSDEDIAGMADKGFLQRPRDVERVLFT